MRKQLILGILCFGIASSAFAATAIEYGMIAAQIATANTAAMATAQGKGPALPALPATPVAPASGGKVAAPPPAVAPVNGVAPAK